MRPPPPPGLEALLALAPSEATPVLLALARAQVARRRPADLLAQARRDGFVAPSALDQRTLHRLDGLALDAAHAYEAVQLSPVAPLGQCAVLAPTSQDRTLTAARATEVVSDPTNTLALLAALRLTAPADGGAPADVRLCTVHQTLRAQALPPAPGFSRHFRLFALAEAGAALPDDGFEVAAIVRALATFEAIFDGAGALGCTLPGRRVRLFATPARRVLAERVRAALALRCPRLEVADAGPPSAYYAGLRALLGADAAEGQHLPLGDVGVFDWVARLASNARLRLVASGLGLQLLALRFRGRSPPGS